MKKVIYVGAFLFLGSMALTSCKKDYTCDCTYKIAGMDAEQSYSFDIKDAKKKDAEDACDYDLAGTQSMNCDLK